MSGARPWNSKPEAPLLNATPLPLAACADWHPGIPSQIRLTHAVGKRGKHFLRRHCTVCRAMFAKKRVQTDTRPAMLAAYGVVRLTWQAPEMLAGEVA